MRQTLVRPVIASIAPMIAKVMQDGYIEKSIEDVDLRQIKGWIEILKKEKKGIGFIGEPPCREFFEHLKKQLINTGYILHERLINSIECGVPQDRERIILIGFQDKQLAQSFEWGGRIYPDGSVFDYNWPVTNEYSMRQYNSLHIVNYRRN